MTTRGDVSIVIPVYNLGQFLPETIASIESARTAHLREIIIVDDGSTDATTMAVLDKLQHQGYSVMRQPNRGVAAARNAGVRSASGKYILPVDSDNRIRRTYLRDAVRLLDTEPSVGVVYGDAEYFGDRRGRWCVDDFSLPQLVRRNYIDACALFRKKLWEELGGYDEQRLLSGWEDWDLWLRAALRGWRFVHVPEIAFDYRVRGGSLLQQAKERGADIDAYMFSKPEFAVIAQMRPELHRLWLMEQSIEHRIGTRLMTPIRRVRQMLTGSRHGPAAIPVRRT